MWTNDDDEIDPGQSSPAALYFPSSVYLSGEDYLRVTAFSNTASVVLAVTGRILRPDSTPTPLADSIAPGNGRTATTKTIPLSEGWLLGLAIAPASGVSALGATWVQVDLVRGAGSSQQLVQTIGYGWVTLRSGFAWPGGVDMLSTDGPGVVRSITGTIPGAGAEISEAVPAGARWQLLAFEADLTTSATVANRVPQLTIDDGTNVYARVSVAQNETASATWRNSFQAGTSGLADVTNHVIMTAIGDGMLLGAGHRIRTVTAALQAGDQYAAPQYLVREWLEGL